MTALVLVALAVLTIAVAVVWPGDAPGPRDRDGSAADQPATATASGTATSDLLPDAGPGRRDVTPQSGASADSPAPDDPSVVVRARWRADGSPAADIPIALLAPGFGFQTTLPAFQETTDAQGEARFEAVPAGAWLATATRDDAVPLLVVAGQPGHAEIVVERHGMVVGSVRDAGGRPVAGIPIHSGGRSMRGATVIARSAADGSFSFRAPGPEILIWAARSAAHSRSREVSLLTYDGERHDVELVVVDEVTTLRGQVLGADGRPVPDAEVIVRDTPPPSPTHPADAFLDLSHARTSCDADGRFEIAGLCRGQLLWRAGAPGHVDRHGSITLPETGTAAELPIELARGATLSGTVRTPDGRVLPGVRVTRSIRDQRGVTTDPAGAFAWDDLETGPRQIIASHPRWGTARRDLQLEAGEHRRVDLVLEPGLVLEGRVVDRGGNAVAGVVVAREGALAVTAADGSFRFVDCADRGYELVVHARLDRIPAVLDRRTGVRPRTGPVEFVVDDPADDVTGWIRGRFERPAGHEDAALRIELRRGKEPGFVLGVPPDGSWAAGPLQPGTWSLRSVPWHSPLDGFHRPDLQLEPGQTLDLGTLRLPAPTTLKLDPQPDPVGSLGELRATIQPLDNPAIRAGLLWRDGRTSPIRSFTPGRWQIDVAPTDHHLGTSLVVELAPGIDNVIPIPITLTRPCRFRVVSDVDGLRRDGAQLALRGAHDLDGIALRNGRATLGVPLGEHMALVEGDGFRGSAVFRVDTLEGPPLDVEIRVR